MNEIPRLQQIMRQTYNGVGFHGDSIAEIFDTLDVASASWIPDGGVHSIWQIVHHMTAWLNVIRERLTSPTLVTLTDEQNYPTPASATPESLAKSLAEFREAHFALDEAVGKFPEGKLDALVPGREYAFAILLHGAIHHNMYHAGQIALLNAMYRRRKS